MRGDLGLTSRDIGQTEAMRELVIDGTGSAKPIELRGGETEVADEGQQQ